MLKIPQGPMLQLLAASRLYNDPGDFSDRHQCYHSAGVQQQAQSATDEELTWTEEPQQLIVLDDFLPSAASLRSHYDSRCSCARRDKS